MADFIGSRRAGELPDLPNLPDPELARRMFAEDDDASTCPKCGAAVRPGQDWCTLCLHVLRPPEPPPPPVSAAPSRLPAVPAATADESGTTAGQDSETEAGPRPDAEFDAEFDVEAAAEALLGQLAIDIKRDSFSVPPFLDSKARIAVFVTVAMTGLCFACLATMGVLGTIFG